MVIIPPEELAHYITFDENGNCIHAKNMPKELDEKYRQFVEKLKKAKEMPNMY